MPRGAPKRDAAAKENTKKVSEKKMQMIQLIKEYPKAEVHAKLRNSLLYHVHYNRI